MLCPHMELVTHNLKEVGDFAPVQPQRDSDVAVVLQGDIGEASRLAPLDIDGSRRVDACVCRVGNVEGTSAGARDEEADDGSDCGEVFHPVKECGGASI